jgi:hypothetical protein
MFRDCHDVEHTKAFRQGKIAHPVYTHHRSKFGAFTPSPAGEGWGEEIQKNEF